MKLFAVTLIGLIGAGAAEPKIRTSAGEIEVSAESFKVCDANGVDCHPVATANVVDAAVQSATAASASTIAELSAELSVARSTLSSQSAALADTMQSIAASLNGTMQSMAVSLGRLDRITDDDVLALTCRGAQYISEDSECLSCTGAGPNNGYFHNSVAGTCQICSEVINHFVNASGYCVPVTLCSDAEFETRAFDQANGRDRTCGALTVCTPRQYASTTPTATRNRVCAGLRTCSSSQYVRVNHTATSNRVCAAQAPACESSEVEAISAGPYQRRVCSAVYRSCSDIWEKNQSARTVDGYYVVTNYADTTLTVARWTAENCGDTGAIHNGQTYSGSFGAPHILGKVRWYSVYSGGARGCRWNLYGRNNGQGWRALGHMQFSTTPERFDANGKWVGGAKVNSAHRGGPGAGCSRYSGWYEYEGYSQSPYQHFQLRQRGGRQGHCPRVSALQLVGRNAVVAPQSVNQVYCDMRRGGWQLVYNRMNLFFTPDHMRQVCPRQGTVARLDEDSTSWCIPNTARRWRWDIAKEDTDFPSPATFKSLITNIPTDARTSGTGNRIINNRVKWYQNDFYPGSQNAYNVFTANPSGASAYYQRGFLNRATGVNQYGCSAGGTSFFGLTRAMQGDASSIPNQTPPWGIGGSCDTACRMAGRNYTHPDVNIRYLHGNWANLHGVTAAAPGGSACVPNDAVRYNFNYRFWAIE